MPGWPVVAGLVFACAGDVRYRSGPPASNAGTTADTADELRPLVPVDRTVIASLLCSGYTSSEHGSDVVEGEVWAAPPGYSPEPVGQVGFVFVGDNDVEVRSLLGALLAKARFEGFTAEPLPATHLAHVVFYTHGHGASGRIEALRPSWASPPPGTWRLYFTNATGHEVDVVGDDFRLDGLADGASTELTGTGVPTTLDVLNEQGAVISSFAGDYGVSPDGVFVVCASPGLRTSWLSHQAPYRAP